MYFYYIFSKILATNIDSITSYSKIREEIKFMYVCMYVTTSPDCEHFLYSTTALESIEIFDN